MSHAKSAASQQHFVQPLTTADRKLLVEDACHYMQLAEAAYGWRGALVLGTQGGSDYGATTAGALMHALVTGGDRAAFAHRAGIDEDCVLYKSKEEELNEPFHWLMVDHSRNELVLSESPPMHHRPPAPRITQSQLAQRFIAALRGTIDLDDTLLDLTAGSCAFLKGHAHEGMAHAAHQLLSSAFDSRRLNLVGHLKRFPGYSLVVTGHSLGGSVAVLLTMLLLHHRHVQESSLPAGHRSGVPMHGVPIRCVTFGSAPVYAVHAPLPPGTQEACVTFVNAEDIVSRLSLWSFMRLMRLAAAVAEAQPTLLQHWTGSEQLTPVDTIRKALQAASERRASSSAEHASPQRADTDTEQKTQDKTVECSSTGSAAAGDTPDTAASAGGTAAGGSGGGDASQDDPPPVTDVGHGSAPTAHQLYIPGTIVYMRGVEHPKASLMESAAEMSKAVSSSIGASLGGWLSWGSGGAAAPAPAPSPESGHEASQDGSRGQSGGMGSAAGAALQAPLAAAASVFAESGLQSAGGEAAAGSDSDGGYASDGGSDPLAGLTHVTAALLDGPRAASSAAGGARQDASRTPRSATDGSNGGEGAESRDAAGAGAPSGGAVAAAAPPPAGAGVSIAGIPQRPPRPDPMRRIPSGSGTEDEEKGPWSLQGHAAFSHVDVRVIHWDQLQDVLPVPGNFTAVHLPNQYRQVVRALQAREQQAQAERARVRDGMGGSPLVYGGAREPVSPTAGAAFVAKADAKKTPVKRGSSASAARSCVMVYTRGHQEEWHAVRGIVAGPKSGVISAEHRRGTGPRRRSHSSSPESTPGSSRAPSRDRAPSDVTLDSLPHETPNGDQGGAGGLSVLTDVDLGPGVIAPGKENSNEN